MKRYAIMVRDNVPEALITELTQVDVNPMKIVHAAKAKIRYVINGRKRSRVRQYDYVYAIDLTTGEQVDR